MTQFAAGLSKAGQRNIIRLSCSLLAILTGGVHATEADQAHIDCAALQDVSISDTHPLSATAVRFVDGERPGIEMAAGEIGLPDCCRTRGVVRPQISFELRLPLADWNGKFYMAGCGAEDEL